MADISAGTPEAELLARAREGERMARQELVKRAYAPMARAIRLLIKDVAAAEDLLQDSLFRLLRELETIRGEAALATFAWQVARTRALNWIRDEANRRRLLDQHGNFVSVEVMGQPPTDPESAAITCQSANRVISAINVLPERERELVTKHIKDDPQDHKVIPCKAVSSTERSRLFRALAKLRALMKDSEEEKPTTPAKVLDSTRRSGLFPVHAEVRVRVQGSGKRKS
jgi:RNA polymerase sigma-70 factor (ECF subfamily)